MKAVNPLGMEVDTGDHGGADPILAALTVGELRRFLHQVLKEGGVSLAKRCEVMRISTATLRRDTKPAP